MDSSLQIAIVVAATTIIIVLLLALLYFFRLTALTQVQTPAPPKKHHRTATQKSQQSLNGADKRSTHKSEAMLLQQQRSSQSKLSQKEKSSQRDKSSNNLHNMASNSSLIAPNQPDSRQQSKSVSSNAALQSHRSATSLTQQNQPQHIQMQAGAFLASASVETQVSLKGLSRPVLVQAGSVTVSPPHSHHTTKDSTQPILQSSSYYPTQGADVTATVALDQAQNVVYAEDQTQILDIEPVAPLRTNALVVNASKYQPYKLGNKLSGLQAVQQTATVNANQFSAGNTTKRSYGTTTMSPSSMDQPQPLSLPGSILTDFEKDIRVVQKLNEGGAGTLFLADIVDKTLKMRADNSAQCVIKVLKDEDMLEEDLVNSFNHEVAIMWMFHLSRNIIKIYGYSESPRSIITKYYPLGSLHDIVHQTSKTSLKFSDSKWVPLMWCRMARDICSGLRVIHEQSITHNDIKTANILLEYGYDQKTLKAVVCDFGIACPIDPAFYGVKMFKRSEIIGASAPYCAPEVFMKLNQVNGYIEDTPEVAKAGDMFSVGVVMYEMAMRRIPWTEIKVDYGKIEQQVLMGNRPKYRDDVVNRWSTDSAFKQFIAHMEMLWNQDSALRPTADQSFETLEQLSK